MALPPIGTAPGGRILPSLTRLGPSKPPILTRIRQFDSGCKRSEDFLFAQNLYPVACMRFHVQRPIRPGKVTLEPLIANRQKPPKGTVFLSPCRKGDRPVVAY